MAGEEAARRTIEQALGRPVVRYDDNSQPSMYDLRIGSINAPEMAVEVVAAVDAPYTETWNRGPAKGPLRLALTGNWTVVISPRARLRTIRPKLETLLQAMEARGRSTLHENYYLREADAALFDACVALGIQHVSCYEPEGTGVVYLTMDGSGGAVDETGAAVPTWIGAFLRDPKHADVLFKLDRSGAARREVFIVATLRGTPWPVEGYLTGDLDQLPPAAPDIRAPVTGVWLVSSFPFRGRGIRWDGAGWHVFST